MKILNECKYLKWDISIFISKNEIEYGKHLIRESRYCFGSINGSDSKWNFWRKLLDRFLGLIFWQQPTILTHAIHMMLLLFTNLQHNVFLSSLGIIRKIYGSKYFVVNFRMVCIKLFVQLPKFSSLAISLVRSFTFMTF